MATQPEKSPFGLRRFVHAVAAIPLATWPTVIGLAGGVGCGADERPASWTYVSTVILQPNCATVSCHSRAAAVAGLDFSDPDRGYISLTQLKVWIVNPTGTAEDGCQNIRGTVVCQRGFRPMVTPFNPEQSRIVNMMRARNAARMPPDRPLPEASIELVERWIRNGAINDRDNAPVRDAGAPERPRPSVTVTVLEGGAGDVRPTSDAASGDAADGAPRADTGRD